MAFKIERSGNGYRITSPGDPVARLRVDARDIDEVCLALKHYYNGKHGIAPSSACPICRSIEEKKW